MMKQMRRVAEPVMRLTSVEPVDHETTFEMFAENLAGRLADDHQRARQVVAVVLRVPR
jgi:hypothetical protein